MLPIWKGIKRDVEKGIGNSEDFFPRADFSESPYWVPLTTGSQWISKSFKSGSSHQNEYTNYLLSVTRFRKPSPYTGVSKN